MRFKQMTKEERRSEGKRLWKELNAKGIYTEEQLDKAIKEIGVIDIGFFVAPLPENAVRFERRECS